ncbi:MAG: acyltransferase [Pseudoflavonifractor sp.]|nr:acyltransferase [Alloprevotella sp.]MCM1116082.1 acyltransferase [Pseudoflavonifractor sp.]
MNPYELSFISRHRSMLMGLSIFWIFFYHTGIDMPGLRELFALGWMGVDIFFFVSGFGLCASLTKDPSTAGFFKRRFVRILPTWWTVLLIMAIFGTYFNLANFPNDVTDYIFWFTSLGWWTGHCNFEWYIPTLILFYLLAPILSRCSMKTLIWVMAGAMFMAMVLGYFSLINHVYLSYSRVAVYVAGFLAYKMMRGGVTLSVRHWTPLMILGLLGFGFGLFVKGSNLTYGLTICRVSIPLFIVPMLFVMARVIEMAGPVYKLFSFLGIISLEIYLLHINHEFSETICGPLRELLSPAVAKIAWFIMVVAAAWLLNKFISSLTAKQRQLSYDRAQK